MWVEDIPVEDLDQDTFQRNHYAQAFAEQIIGMQSERSFAIGILGEYGSGKTSFINLIKKHLEGQKVDVLNFNAWKSEKAENIQMDFFDHLASEVKESQQNLSSLLTSYSRKLSRIDSSAETLIKRVGFVNQLLNNVQTEADEYERINDILKRSDRKLVVVIDDMDRLYSNEVIEVLRLVRNTANFTNTFYLLAYEKGYIQNAIKEQLHVDIHVPFMDKIVQMEIPLPKREQSNLLDLLKQHLSGRVSETEFQTLENVVFRHGFNKGYEHTFHDIFRNARDVIKFVNSFLISYTLLKENVLFEKLFLIELLKYRYPSFYERLYQHRDDFLAIEEKRYSYQGFYLPRKPKESSNARDKKDDHYNFQTYLISESFHTDDIRIIKGIMMALFNNYSWSVQATKSIVYPASFERYFRFRLSGSEIPEKEFNNAWTEGIQAMVKFIDKCYNENLTRQLANMLFMIEPKNKEHFELLIKSIFHLGVVYQKKKTGYSFDFNALIDLLWNFNGMPAQRFYKNDVNQYKNLLHLLFNKAPFPFSFQSELIWHINSESQKTPLSQKELVDYQIIYFCEYVHQKGLDEMAISLMWKIRIRKAILDSTGKAIDREFVFAEELKPHLIDFLSIYDPTEFLKGIIKKEHAGKGFKIYPQLISLFSDPEELRLLVKNGNKIKVEIKEEFLDFFDQLQNNDFQSYIPFEFETELKPKSNDDED